MKDLSICIRCKTVTTVKKTDSVFEKLSADLFGRTAFCVTDETIFSLYGEKIKSVFGEKICVIKGGESAKTEKTLFSLISEFYDAELTKDSVVVAFGGGSVGDVTGLACSLFKRGLIFYSVPTTLLAQVDSAYGGKTAVNFGTVKNLIGCFYPANTVYLDDSFLRTLSKDEISSGAGEMVKCALLDKKLYKKISGIKEYSADTLSPFILDCVRLKSKFVERDFFDKGARRALNSGHTTAHALELFSKKPHGVCVAFGLLAEVKMAQKEGATDDGFMSLVSLLIQNVCKESEFSFLQNEVGNIVETALFDKKNGKNTVSVVVPVSLGKWKTLAFTKEKYGEYLKEILSERSV